MKKKEEETPCLWRIVVEKPVSVEVVVTATTEEEACEKAIDAADDIDIGSWDDGSDPTASYISDSVSEPEEFDGVEEGGQ
jgi:hypothetical protein